MTRLNAAWFVGLMTVAGACGGTNIGKEGQRGYDNSDTTEGSLSADAGVQADSASQEGTDAGAQQTTQPTQDAAAGPLTAFTGAPAFASGVGPSSRKGEHNFAGNTPTTNPAKQACNGCHSAGNGAPVFLFAGTVYADTAGTIPAANVEVRVRAASGVAVSVFTDADGNFYRRPGATDPALPAITAVRNATQSVRMVSGISNGDCNSCHRAGGTAAIIHIP